MNKKYLNIVLLGLLLIIWGGVVYKYFGKSGAVENTLAEYTNAPVLNPNAKTAKDTFQLQLINKNPFKTSKIQANTYPTGKKDLKKKSIIKPKTKTTPKWPTITYHGFVKGNKNNTRLILLKINNKLCRKREKEIINGVTLIKAYHDSLEVSFNNNTKYIQKIHG